MNNKLNAILIFILMLSVSCSSSSPSDDKKTININLGPQTKAIDPSLSSTLIGSYYIAHAFEGLTRTDKSGNIVGGVAESWEEFDNGTRYVFHLRTNAKWNDGKIVTANDFVYTWKRVVDPITVSDYNYLMSPIKNADKIIAGELSTDDLGVKAIDDYTFEVLLERPTAYFLDLTSFSVFFPVRKDIVEQYGDSWSLDAKTYIGNGPYTTIEISADDKIVMVKNTNYWNSDSIVAEKLNFIIMQNETASVAGIKEGSIDFSKILPTQDIPALQEEGLIQIKPSLASFFYCLSTTNEVLKDVRIRKALALAIDREYIVKQITKAGERAASAFVPYGVKDASGDFRENGGDYFDVSSENYQNNIEEAKKLMAEAGYPNGEGFPVFEFNSDPGINVAIFEAVQQMWKENLGIDTKIVQEELSVFLSRRFSRDFTIARGGWFADFNDPINFLELFASYSPYNFSSFSNAQYDEYIKTALGTSDQKIRMEAMHKAEDILINSFAIIPMYFYSEPLLVSSKLKDVLYDPLSVHKFYYSYKE